MMQKVRTLAVQANNGTNTKEDKDALAKEMGSLLTEVHRISNQTTYGGATVLNGDASTSIYKNAVAAGGAGGAAPKGDPGQITFQVGANAGDTIDLTVDSYNFSKIFSRAKETNDQVAKSDFFEAADKTADAAKSTKLLVLDKESGSVIVNLNSATPADDGDASN